MCYQPNIVPGPSISGFLKSLGLCNKVHAQLAWATRVVQPLVYLPRTPFFSSFLWINRFLWRKREKLQDSYPIPFSILHMSTSFHYDRTNNKKVFFLGVQSSKFSDFVIYICNFLKTLKENFRKLLLLVLGTIWGCYGQNFSLIARTSASNPNLTGLKARRQPSRVTTINATVPFFNFL